MLGQHATYSEQFVAIRAVKAGGSQRIGLALIEQYHVHSKLLIQAAKIGRRETLKSVERVNLLLPRLCESWRNAHYRGILGIVGDLATLCQCTKTIVFLAG